jgi:hypothetical protein
MSKKSINPSQQKLLWGKSASRCAICKEILHKPDIEGKPEELKGNKQMIKELFL